MARNLATQMAPPFVLVAHYFIAAAIFYAVSAFLLPFYANEIDGYFLSSSMASLIHLYLLGFVMMTIFGAMYQLIPVVLEIPVFSKDFAYVQFYLFLGGIILFCFGLGVDKYMAVVPYGAMMIYLSMLIFVANIFLTYKNLERFDIVAKYIFASNVFLFIGSSVGFFMALNLLYGFYPDLMSLAKIHIATTIFGYVIMSIMGVAMVLLPMFSLSHGYSQQKIKWAFYAIITGLSVLLVAELFHVSELFYTGVALSAFAMLLAILQMFDIFRARIRRQNDFWAKNMIASFFTLLTCIVVFFVGIFSSEQKYFILFGFLFFFGFLLFFIVGHIYKILPFLVWYQRFSPLVGKMKVPMLNQMIKEKQADVQFFITFVGMALGCVGIIFTSYLTFAIASVIMGIGTLLVIDNIYFTLTFKPKKEATNAQ
ncbi:MAG: hypothetical protein IBX44_00575 [Sulfurospirillum sp.]|nr:hypothetical protein [Sulfurospirillum sp.]